MAGGTVASEGRVEVLRDGAWGTVRDEMWTLSDAMVICRALGYPGALQATKSALFGEGIGVIWMDNVRCNGNESSLEECPHTSLQPCHISGSCYSHANDVGVICKNGTKFSIF